MQFLQGLHESFYSLRSHILLIEPFPSVNKVYSLISQEEKHRELISSHFTSNNASALVAKKYTPDSNRCRGSSSKEQIGSSSNCNCSYCHRDGHTIDECYKLHGYPPRKKTREGPRNHIGLTTLLHHLNILLQHHFKMLVHCFLSPDLQIQMLQSHLRFSLPWHLQVSYNLQII